jgi:hypothetical protein
MSVWPNQIPRQRKSDQLPHNIALQSQSFGYLETAEIPVQGNRELQMEHHQRIMDPGIKSKSLNSFLIFTN